MEVTCYTLALRHVGIREYKGAGNHHPLIQFWHSLCGLDPSTPDEVPWCSSAANGIAWALRLPRSKSAAARSWLLVGTPIALEDAAPENDVVILKRGKGPQPGPEVTSRASGHVGFFAGIEGSKVLILGGNQNDEFSIQRFPAKDVLGVRRLAG